MAACAHRKLAHRVSLDAGNRRIGPDARRSYPQPEPPYDLLRRRRTQRIEQCLHDGQQLSFGRPGLFRYHGQRPSGHRPQFLARAAHFFQTDLSFAKNTRLPFFFGESANLELRANFFNVFNQLNLMPLTFGGTGTHADEPFFGESAGALAGRVAELQARFSF
jgi:hypothetical protein